MQTHVVELSSEIQKSFRTQKAADSVNLKIEEKSTHKLTIEADLDSKFNIGLIVGNSGSGKTTLAKKVWGEAWLENKLDEKKAIIDQFPEHFSYDDCASALTGMGLTSIPCWVRPAITLSTGQKARAEAALKFASEEKITVIDEWTSTVDRTVAKVMSHAIQKEARKSNRTLVLVGCHYDVIEWLNPDWIIDCNTQSYLDRRSMVGAFTRSDRLSFDVRECDKRSWKYFSKYHYLSPNLPGGKIFTFGLFEGDRQVGFQCFACYSMVDKKLYHSNRVVVHPDYVGFGLGIQMATVGANEMVKRGFTVKAKLTSLAMVKARQNHRNWKLREVKRMVSKSSNSPLAKSFLKKADQISAEGRNKAKLNYVKYFFYDFAPG